MCFSPQNLVTNELRNSLTLFHGPCCQLKQISRQRSTTFAICSSET